jgi:hypothetical protein
MNSGVTSNETERRSDGETAPTPKQVCIAIPIYGGMPAQSVCSLVALSAAPPRPIKILTRVNDSLVTRTRNVLTADFLATDCERLLFIDSDLIFTQEHVDRITSHEVDICAGFYPIKEDGAKVRWCVNGPDGSTGPTPDARGLAPVKYIGTGFMCIHRRVFERMIAAGVATPYVTDDDRHRPEHDFWPVGVVTLPGRAPRYMSEDWYFCQRALDLGYPIWGDVQVQLRHVGTAVWPLKHQT